MRGGPLVLLEVGLVVGGVVNDTAEVQLIFFQQRLAPILGKISHRLFPNHRRPVVTDAAVPHDHPVKVAQRARRRKLRRIQHFSLRQPERLAGLYEDQDMARRLRLAELIHQFGGKHPHQPQIFFQEVDLLVIDRQTESVDRQHKGCPVPVVKTNRFQREGSLLKPPHEETLADFLLPALVHLAIELVHDSLRLLLGHRLAFDHLYCSFSSPI